MYCAPEEFRCLFVKLNARNLKEGIALLQESWNRAAPGYPFEYKWLDERIADLYKFDRQIGTIINLFTGLAVFIACLGLFGLASFMAEQRTKEIGVRKVLGASTSRILFLMSKEFLKWVGMAGFFALPLASWGMSRWLRVYASRIGFEVWMYVLSLGLSLGIALLTVTYQSLKAALSDPVNSLRYE
jgi:putative ABC transport system permease protein